jgi:transcriptional regulator with XRE-family HTH domain
MTITVAQIRGARGILDWSQSDLSKRTGISTTSIGAIENAQTTPRASTLETIRSVFEKNGIEFLGLDGVRVAKNYIEFYEGPEKFKEFMDSLYEHAKAVGGEYVLFNAYPPHWHKWLGKDWFDMHSKRMSELGNKINFKITTIENTNVLISKDFAEYRWVPKELFNDRAVYAYGDKVAFVNFEEKSVSVTVLTQPHFADAFKALFNVAWDNVAKLPETSEDAA